MVWYLRNTWLIYFSLPALPAPPPLLNRDPVWKYLQTVQYGAHGNFPRLSYPTFFPRFEFQDIIPPDDFLTSDEELDSILFGTLRGHVVGLRYYTGVVSITLDIKLKCDVYVVLI